MAKNLTAEHVLREAWDEVNLAIKTVPANTTSFSIELDASDGDNVLTKPDNNVLSADGTISIVGMKTLCLFGTVTTLEISPVDTGNTWFTITPTSLSPITICARRLRATGLTGNIVVQAI